MPTAAFYKITVSFHLTFVASKYMDKINPIEVSKLTPL